MTDREQAREREDPIQERREQLVAAYADAYNLALRDIAACARERRALREALEDIAYHPRIAIADVEVPQDGSMRGIALKVLEGPTTAPDASTTPPQPTEEESEQPR